MLLLLLLAHAYQQAGRELLMKYDLNKCVGTTEGQGHRNGPFRPFLARTGTGTATERAGCQASAELALVLPMTAQVSMTCNHILQNHYPERLGLAVCYHAPMLFSLTWKVRWADGGVASDVGLAPHAAHLKHLCAMQR